MSTFTFKIVAETNPYIAKRDPMFKGHTIVTLATGLSERAANERLLDLFNEKFEDEYYADSWEEAISLTEEKIDCAYNTSSDGTRRFDFDGRTFHTVIED